MRQTQPHSPFQAIAPLALLLLAFHPLFPAGAIDGENDVLVTVPTGEPLGWKTFEILSGNDPLGSRAQEGFSWTPRHLRWDGLGAYRHDATTLRVFMNHESGPNSTFSRIDLNIDNLKSWIGNGFANNNNSNQALPPGPIVKAVSTGWLAWVSPGGRLPINSPCSGNVWQENTFGTGRGFANTVYLTGEETFDSSGRFWVMDVDTRTVYECPDLGGGSWENACIIDTGRTDTIALVLAEDIGASAAGTAPLRLYVGQKTAGNFLQRNGLSGGTVYYWDPDGSTSTNGTMSGIFSAGSGASVTGTWVASPAGAALFSKLEDVHTRMSDGKMVAAASQGQAVFTVDFSATNFAMGNLASANEQSAVTVLYAAGTQPGASVLLVSPGSTPIPTWQFYGTRADSDLAAYGATDLGYAFWFYYRAFADKDYLLAVRNKEYALHKFNGGLAYYYLFYYRATQPKLANYAFWAFYANAASHYYRSLGDFATATYVYNYYVTIALAQL